MFLAFAHAIEVAVVAAVGFRYEEHMSSATEAVIKYIELVHFLSNSSQSSILV